MKPILIFVTSYLFVCAQAFAATAKSPNIVFILADDRDWADLDGQGADANLRTPNLDRLDHDGGRFEFGYVTGISGKWHLNIVRVTGTDEGEGKVGRRDLLPYLTEGKQGPPHQTLYWRWVDQAAIQEFPYKLILLGRNMSMLFDITKPEGEDHTRELNAQQQEIAKRLRTKLDTWLATLNPPGPPRSLQREEGYTEAKILPGKTEASP